MLCSASYSLVQFVRKNKCYRSHLVCFILENNNYTKPFIDTTTVCLISVICSSLLRLMVQKIL